jgi:hypothetical protein
MVFWVLSSKNMLMYRLLTTHSSFYLFDRRRPARFSRTINLILPPCNTIHRLNSFFVQGRGAKNRHFHQIDLDDLNLLRNRFEIGIDFK